MKDNEETNLLGFIVLVDLLDSDCGETKGE